MTIKSKRQAQSVKTIRTQDVMTTTVHGQGFEITQGGFIGLEPPNPYRKTNLQHVDVGQEGGHPLLRYAFASPQSVHFCLHTLR